jgi:cardiolipin synthase (CMP-forming)
MTVPNLLTFCRILLTPLLMWCLLNQKMNQALVVFVCAGLTDVLDGLTARLFHQKSRFGALLDPLADKFLLLSSFLILGYLDLLPLWLVVLVVLRDAVIVVGTSILFLLRVQLEIQPTLLGKLTTLSQLLMVLSVLGASLISMLPWNLVLIWTTAGCSLASGSQYVMKGVAALQSHQFPEGTRH